MNKEDKRMFEKWIDILEEGLDRELTKEEKEKELRLMV